MELRTDIIFNYESSVLRIAKSEIQILEHSDFSIKLKNSTVARLYLRVLLDLNLNLKHQTKMGDIVFRTIQFIYSYIFLNYFLNNFCF